MEVNGAPELLCFPHSSDYLPLCSAEQRHSYRFGQGRAETFGGTGAPSIKGAHGTRFQ